MILIMIICPDKILLLEARDLILSLQLISTNHINMGLGIMVLSLIVILIMGHNLRLGLRLFKIGQ